MINLNRALILSVLGLMSIAPAIEARVYLTSLQAWEGLSLLRAIYNGGAEGAMLAAFYDGWTLGWAALLGLVFCELLIRADDSLRFTIVYRRLAAMLIVLAIFILLRRWAMPIEALIPESQSSSGYLSSSIFWLFTGPQSFLIAINMTAGSLILLSSIAFVVGKCAGYRVHLGRAWIGLTWAAFFFSCLQIVSRLAPTLFFENRFGSFIWEWWELFYIFAINGLILGSSTLALAYALAGLRGGLFSKPVVASGNGGL